MATACRTRPGARGQLYCRASRYGDAEAQYSLAWMLTNARGIERDDAQAAHLFAAAAEQGHEQAQAMAQRLGTPLGAPPPCLRPPDGDPLPLAAPAAAAVGPVNAPGHTPVPLPRPAAAAPAAAHAPPQIVRFVNWWRPSTSSQPHVVLAVIAQESNFDPLACRRRTRRG
jgi:soluble lytic murein transglycosylase-like protein